MKDYSKSVEERKLFIKNYKIKNGKIIVKLASGESYSIRYSEENEKLILDKMKLQAESIIPKKPFIKNYKKIDDKIIVKLATGESYSIPYSEENETSILDRMKLQADPIRPKKLDLGTVMLSISASILLPFMIMALVINGGVTLTIFSIIMACGAVSFPLNIILYKLKERELVKLSYYSYYHEELNEYVKTKENILLGVSKKAIKQIKQVPKEKEIFDFNVIENYSLNDLKIIKENIYRYLNSGFDENEKTNNKEEEGNTLIIK